MALSLTLADPSTATSLLTRRKRSATSPRTTRFGSHPTPPRRDPETFTSHPFTRIFNTTLDAYTLTILFPIAYAREHRNPTRRASISRENASVQNNEQNGTDITRAIAITRPRRARRSQSAPVARVRARWVTGTTTPSAYRAQSRARRRR